jgi:predicted DNA-binding transcriptional regulator AlpA
MSESEITTHEAAAIVGVSRREFYRIWADHDLEPIRYSYKKVRWRLNHILALREERRLEAIRRGVELKQQQARNGHAKRKAA